MEQAMHLMLVDGSGFIFRAFHALPPMTNPEGVPVNAVFGFTNMLTRLLREHQATHLAVIFDAGRTTHRTRLYDQYKAHRPEPPEELKPQFALVRRATEAFGVPAVELADWEADDLIASYARAATDAGGQVTIVSSDKDMMQLIRDGVVMQDPLKQKLIGPAEVMEKFGVPPEKVTHVQALIGDSVDNVPGVPGIGPKNASALITEYGTIQNVLDAAETMKASKRRDNLIAYREQAMISFQLVQLSENVDLPVPLEKLIVAEPDRAQLTGFLSSMGFRSIAAKMDLPEKPSTPTPTPSTEGPSFSGYECVTEPETLQRWIDDAHRAGAVALDTETTGLNAMTADLVGFSLAIAPGKACYVPLDHRAPGTKDKAPKADQLLLEEPTETRLPGQIDKAQALALLEPLLADRSVLKILHNAKYDLLVLRNAGVQTIAPIDDTMLISYAQEAGAHGHGMDELSSLYFDHRPIAYDQVTGTGRNRICFSEVPLDRATEYAAEDADVTFRLWQTLKPRLRENGALTVYEQMDRRLLPVVAEMEIAGIRIDEAELRRMSVAFAERMDVLEQDIHKLAGRTFQVSSPKQLGEILFDEMGLPGGKRLPSGIWGTDASVLQTLSDEGHELPSKVLSWRQLAKLKSTYSDALVTQINPRTHRVHTSFSLAQTSTGRFSSNDPNLQNIPIRSEEGKLIRRAFVAAPGHKLISCDYSQIELRLLAHVADVPSLKESFARGEDIHARTGDEVFGADGGDISPAERRRRAKTINFGIIYGISAFGLATRLGITPGQARAYIEAYFHRYPEIPQYMERTKQEARDQGYVLTLFNRRCWIPQIKDRKQQIRAYAERAAINAPLQGGAADIIRRAIVAMPEALRSSGLKARLLLQVHDELVFEAPDDEAEACAELAKQVMENAAKLSVPLVVETGIGRSWAEAH